mmetsp:Transcript_48559/g.128750  ORF Transcript_48559/g.128750 Transcript_48559/m.128750 type:complete len:248 (+) Transcript_48559:640-1383(+)
MQCRSSPHISERGLGAHNVLVRETNLLRSIDGTLQRIDVASLRGVLQRSKSPSSSERNTRLREGLLFQRDSLGCFNCCCQGRHVPNSDCFLQHLHRCLLPGHTQLVSRWLKLLIRQSRAFAAPDGLPQLDDRLFARSSEKGSTSAFLSSFSRQRSTGIAQLSLAASETRGNRVHDGRIHCRNLQRFGSFDQSSAGRDLGALSLLEEPLQRGNSSLPGARCWLARGTRRGEVARPSLHELLRSLCRRE